MSIAAFSLCAVSPSRAACRRSGSAASRRPSAVARDGAPQGHIPRVHDLTESVGSIGERGDFFVDVGDGTRFEQRDDPETASKELEARVARGCCARQDLGSGVEPVLDVCGAGDDVAPRRERVAEREGIAGSAGDRDSFLAEVGAALAVGVKGERNR